jgi:hypothetical protein
LRIEGRGIARLAAPEDGFGAGEESKTADRNASSASATIGALRGEAETVIRLAH